MRYYLSCILILIFTDMQVIALGAYAQLMEYKGDTASATKYVLAYSLRFSSAFTLYYLSGTERLQKTTPATGRLTRSPLTEVTTNLRTTWTTHPGRRSKCVVIFSATFWLAKHASLVYGGAGFVIQHFCRDQVQSCLGQDFEAKSDPTGSL